MPDLTFCIPVGPAHGALAKRAVESVQAQTVSCEILLLTDDTGRGPAPLRNAMLAKVTTPFVSFLDADDWIEPTFAEETLAEYARIGGDKYIFTDWFNEHNQPIEAPQSRVDISGQSVSRPGWHPYCGGTWHVITTLIPTEWARVIGGFDESLPGSEDTDFFLKLCTTFRCGHRLARPLFHYSPHGERSKAFHYGPEFDRVMGGFTLKYGGQMGCCGDDVHIVSPTGQQQPGDVLAMALWHGNRQVNGRATGRIYPRLSMPKTAWVSPADVAAAPHEWRIVQSAAVDEPQSVTTVAQLATAMMSTVHQTRNPYPAPASEPPAPEVTTKPDVARVVKLGNLAMKATSDPIFIFPKKDYPSYIDAKRLVELSGYDITDPEHIDAFSKRPYIVLSPEFVGDLNGFRARVICWQLEYAGDYTENYKDFTGEVWASDKAWADVHGAKYVLMGSDPLLGNTPHQIKDNDGKYLRITHTDLTMLGYMTPRRQAVKDRLSDLRWNADYPGHGDPVGRDSRDLLLSGTTLMLHVHQHDGSPYCAPQRIALAAAYHMRCLSETVTDAGELAGYVTYADYDKLVPAVKRELKKTADPDKLYNYLCVERTFSKCVEEALNAR